VVGDLSLLEFYGNEAYWELWVLLRQ